MPIFSSGKNGQYECIVILLDEKEQRHEITGKTLGDELLHEIFKRLKLFEKEYFGLRFKDYYGDVHWLDPNKSVKKQAIGQKAPYRFYLGVKFYAADPTRLREEITRYQFFLQVKKDILNGKIQCDENVAAELCAYAVQSELGDYNPSVHDDDFVSQFRFVPDQTERLEEMIADAYPKLKGLLPAEAEMKFLERVKWLGMYGVDMNPVKGQDKMDYLLGLTPTGIVLFKAKTKIGSFIWPKITKLKYKGNCFLLRATQGKNNEEKEYTFICQNKDKAKTLWKNCAEHHAFFRLEKANDVPASAYNFLFRKNSTFKFRGRTQQEVENEFDRRPRSQTQFSRTPSQRFNKRGKSGLSETALNRDFGLYSNGPKNTYLHRPRSVHSDYRSDVVDRGQSPKYNRRSGYNSSGEGEQRKKRYYSGYTSVSDVESVRKNGTKYGSAPNIHHRNHHQQNSTSNNDYHGYTPEENHHHRRKHSRESLPGLQHYGAHQHTNDDQRHYRPSGSKSDGEDSSRRRHHHRHHRQSDSEMVAPLDVYHNVMGVALNNDEKKPRQHRHHRRHHHSQQRHHRSAGHVYNPNQSELLLELGPDSKSQNPLSSTPHSDKENVHPQRSNGGNRNHNGNGVPSSQQRFINQYLPPHLLKQKRPPMNQVPASGGGGIPGSGAGGGGSMYRPQYVEQVVTPVRSGSHKNLKNLSSNYNITTEL